MAAAGRPNPANEEKFDSQKAAQKYKRLIEQEGAKGVKVSRLGLKHVVRWNPLGVSEVLMLSQPVFKKAGKKLGVPTSLSGVLPMLGNRGRKKKKNAGTRRNPVEAAQSKYEEFHGRPSEELLEVETPIHVHDVLSGLGKLERMDIRTLDGRFLVKLRKFSGAILAQNENSDEMPQLYIEGGDQEVDLSLFSLRAPYHEYEQLGTLERIDYYTIKDHLGADGGEAIYRHRLVKLRTRGKPAVIYDVRNKLLQIVGGSYTIQPEGIVN